MNMAERIQTYLNDRGIKGTAIDGSFVHLTKLDDQVFYSACGLSTKQMRRIARKHDRDRQLMLYGRRIGKATNKVPF